MIPPDLRRPLRPGPARPRHPGATALPSLALGILLALFIALGGLGPRPALGAGDTGAALTTGSKKFTESVILGEILAQLLRAEGLPATHRRELGGTQMVFGALKSGDIDLYVDYRGTLTEEIFAKQDLRAPGALEAALNAVGVGLGPALGFNNTYALGMVRARAKALGIETIGDLRDHPGLSLGFSHQFLARPDGWPGVRAAYDLPQTDPRGMDHDLAYRGIQDQTLDVVDLYSTDAEIPYYDLVSLEDDRGHFPRYDALILYGLKSAEAHPGLAAALARLEGALTAEEMARMNKAVKVDRIPDTEVAAAFLAEALGVTPAAAPRAEGPWARLAMRLLEHLFMVAVSLGAAVAVSIPLGVWCARRPRAGRLILGVVGGMQTIPSLALLVFMIPLMGIGYTPAIVALFLYSLLPIVRNTHAGLVGIPEGLRQSALALGLTEGARLRLIELPLALPSILAGIQTSAVINVGTATLGALIGAGGLGQPILTGIRLDDTGLILMGAIPAALLALAAQGAFELLEQRVVPEGMRGG